MPSKKANAEGEQQRPAQVIFFAVCAAYLFLGSGDAQPFNVQNLSVEPTGIHDQLPIEDGHSGSTFRVFYKYNGRRISPWHDIPLHAGQSKHSDTPTYHFVCEIPFGTKRKMEINKVEEFNPIAQDVKKGILREYKYIDPTYGKGSTVNYGALTQTWEDPETPHKDTLVGGDNDPIDVLQINEKPCEMGEVQRVRVLGTLALIDGGETDWKLIVVHDDDDKMKTWNNVLDVPKDRVDQLRDWFRNYKTAEGKPVNKFALDGEAKNATYAREVVEETHKQWKNMFAPTARKCRSGGDSCWVEKA